MVRLIEYFQLIQVKFDYIKCEVRLMYNVSSMSNAPLVFRYLRDEALIYGANKLCKFTITSRQMHTLKNTSFTLLQIVIKLTEFTIEFEGIHRMPHIYRSQ